VLPSSKEPTLDRTLAERFITPEPNTTNLILLSLRSVFKICLSLTAAKLPVCSQRYLSVVFNQKYYFIYNTSTSFLSSSCPQRVHCSLRASNFGALKLVVGEGSLIRRVSEGSLLAGQTLGGSLTFTSKFAWTTEFVCQSIPNPMNTSLP
jgi:hypothetical protein